MSGAQRAGDGASPNAGRALGASRSGSARLSRRHTHHLVALKPKSCIELRTRCWEAPALAARPCSLGCLVITQQLSDLALLGLQGRVLRAPHGWLAFPLLIAETPHGLLIAVAHCSQHRCGSRRKQGCRTRRGPSQPCLPATPQRQLHSRITTYGCSQAVGSVPWPSRSSRRRRMRASGMAAPPPACLPG